jgi:hypothetical protein
MPSLRAALAAVWFAAAAILGAAPSSAQVGISITVAPPVLPVYAQPPIPGPGYLWTPGYWGWGAYGYYWVPGTWVLPPAVGLLWTPGYWGWRSGAFLFHAGYWGPTVGFYGGINYGFGYAGVGFAGGYWAHGGFYYNRAVTNISNTRITNVYNRNVTVNRTTNVSYNGGAGGTNARATPAELAAAREQRTGPTTEQTRNQSAAGRNPALQATANHGVPPVAATSRPGEFAGRGVEAAQGAVARPAVTGGNRPGGAGASAAGIENRSVGGAARAPAAAREHRPPVGSREYRPAATTGAAPHAGRPSQERRYERPQSPYAAPERGPHQAAAPRPGAYDRQGQRRAPQGQAEQRRDDQR